MTIVTLEKVLPPKVLPKALHQLRSLLSSGHEEEGAFVEKKGALVTKSRVGRQPGDQKKSLMISKYYSTWIFMEILE